MARRNTLDQGFFGSPVLYDLDGDGDLEIINAAMDQHVYVWDHDGSTHAGFPVLCRDVADGNRGFRIVQTPAVGDIDLDGSPEIITGTNEYYNENETRIYILHADGNDHAGGPFELGGPILNFGLIGEVLPVVGEGTVSNPVIADVDFDGHPEFAMESLAGQPIFHRLDPDVDDEELIEVNRVNNVVFGSGSNSLDTPAYPLINNGSFGRVDPSGDLAYVKGTAGFNFASSFAEGGTRLVFDHHISAWNTNPAKNPGDGGPFIEGFPQKVDDWQFFMNPALFDIDSDGLSEVVLGTGGYLVRAFNYRGEQPAGWPKSTGGWIISSPAVGDVDGDGMFEVATGTRNGWFFVWNTDAPTTNRLDWQSFGHDPANTNNYATPLPSYGEAVCGNGVREGDEACDGADLGGVTCADQDGFDGGDLACTDCALDTSGCTTTPGNNGNNGNNGTNNGDPDTGTPDAGDDDTGNPGGGGGGGDDGCCTVAPSASASIPMLPTALALLAIVGLVVRRLR